MARFDSKPLNPSKLNRAVQKNPALFGIPFILLMVAASYGMSTFTQTRYDLHDHKVKQVRCGFLCRSECRTTRYLQMTKAQELGLDKQKKKFDIREEYFKLSSKAEDDWEPKRIQRPKGLPEWGVPPTEPPEYKKS
ncbi:hypothetical protein C8R42DRAFT_578975 [Lentinula raphanica]|nr:hypothetical protein C8R42DRAFT_578975 [Lentinula raphanica]